MMGHKQRRAVLRRFADERWITIWKKSEESKGRPVKIDSKGNIVGGAVPKSWQGKSVRGGWKGGEEPKAKGEEPKQKTPQQKKPTHKPLKGATSWNKNATQFNKRLAAAAADMKDSTLALLGSRGTFDEADMSKAKSFFPKGKRIVVPEADRYQKGSADYTEYEVTRISKVKDGFTVAVRMTEECKKAHGREGEQYERFNKTNLRNLAKKADTEKHKVYF